MNKTSITKLVIFVLICLAIFILNWHFGWSDWLANRDNLIFLQDIVKENLPLAFLIYCILTVVGCVFLALPGLIFAILSGLIFGPFLGIVACDVACTLGAVGAFVAGRYFLKDSIKPMLQNNKTLNKFLFSGNEKNDTILLMVTRMVPIFPYNLQNFAYGITDVGLLKYTILTFVFMLPGVSFFVIGAAGISAESNQWIYYVTAAILAIAVTLAGIFIKRKFLSDESK